MATEIISQQPQSDPVIGIVNKLSATFRNTTKPIPFSNPMLKRLQVHFMYFVDEVQRGPVYDQSKLAFFVLKWTHKIGDVLATNKSDAEKTAELEELLTHNYTHNNFYISAV